MGYPTYKKDPDARLRYTVDWAAWLAESGETSISSSTWVVPGGITNVSTANTTTTASIVLSGGTSGTYYEVVNRITTSPSSLINDQTLLIHVTPT